LTPEEQSNVKSALRVLRVRLGGLEPLSKELKCCSRTVKWAYSKKRRPSAGLAARAARLANVPIDDVLSGAFPKPGTCPHCGRSDS